MKRTSKISKPKQIISIFFVSVPPSIRGGLLNFNIKNFRNQKYNKNSPSR